MLDFNSIASSIKTNNMKITSELKMDKLQIHWKSATVEGSKTAKNHSKQIAKFSSPASSRWCAFLSSTSSCREPAVCWRCHKNWWPFPVEEKTKNHVKVHNQHQNVYFNEKLCAPEQLFAFAFRHRVSLSNSRVADGHTTSLVRRLMDHVSTQMCVDRSSISQIAVVLASWVRNWRFERRWQDKR